jgi:outer membrane protein assembly factor BamB
VPTLRAYTLADGSERWVYRAESNVADDEPIGVGAITEPVMSGNSVLFGVSIRAPASGATGILDGLYAVAIDDGSLQWHAVADTPIGSSPAVLDGTIYAMGGLRPRGDATRGYLIAFSGGS